MRRRLMVRARTRLRMRETMSDHRVLSELFRKYYNKELKSELCHYGLGETFCAHITVRVLDA